MNASGSSVDSMACVTPAGRRGRSTSRSTPTAVLRRQRQHQAFGEAELKLDVVDHVRAALEARELGRRLDRIAQRAEPIDEPAIERIGADPDAAVRGGVDLLDRALAVLRDLANELVIRLTDRQADEPFDVVAERPRDLERAGQAASCRCRRQCTPNRSSARGIVGIVAPTPIDPVSVVGLAQISSAAIEIQ